MNAEVWVVVNYFEGQPKYECIHYTKDVALSCCAKRAAARAGEEIEPDFNDLLTDFNVSTHEWFRVQRFAVLDHECQTVDTNQ